MSNDSNYIELAERAERFAQAATDERFAACWREMATGFRRLAERRADVSRFRQRSQEDSQDRADVAHARIDPAGTTRGKVEGQDFIGTETLPLAR